MDSGDRMAAEFESQCCCSTMMTLGKLLSLFLPLFIFKMSNDRTYFVGSLERFISLKQCTACSEYCLVLYSCYYYHYLQKKIPGSVDRYPQLLLPGTTSKSELCGDILVLRFFVLFLFLSQLMFA